MRLPPSIQFIERDWLSANHILFQDASATTLVDTGYVSTVDTTLELVRAALAKWQAPSLTHIINTHIHSDHIGGNRALQEAYPDVSIAIPEGEVAALSAWDTPEQMLTYADQRANRFTWHETLEADSSLLLGGYDWRVIATPGHDMGSIVLYCEALRTLIAADALWENGFGFVPPQAIDPKPLAAQRATFAMLRTLDVALVLPGHGPMFSDFSGALQRAESKLEAFAQDDMKIARNVAKGMFFYSMMWRKSMPLNDVARYLSSIDVHRDYNAQFFRLSNEAYAHWLIEEGLRAGQLFVQGDQLQIAKR